MTNKRSDHPDFWGREGRGGEEWDVIDRPDERGEQPGPKFFETPKRVQPDADAAKQTPAPSEARPKG